MVIRIRFRADLLLGDDLGIRVGIVAHDPHRDGLDLLGIRGPQEHATRLQSRKGLQPHQVVQATYLQGKAHLCRLGGIGRALVRVRIRSLDAGTVPVRGVCFIMVAVDPFHQVDGGVLTAARDHVGAHIHGKMRHFAEKSAEKSVYVRFVQPRTAVQIIQRRVVLLLRDDLIPLSVIEVIRRGVFGHLLGGQCAVVDPEAIHTAAPSTGLIDVAQVAIVRAHTLGRFPRSHRLTVDVQDHVGHSLPVGRAVKQALVVGDRNGGLMQVGLRPLGHGVVGIRDAVPIEQADTFGVGHVEAKLHIPVIGAQQGQGLRLGSIFNVLERELQGVGIPCQRVHNRIFRNGSLREPLVYTGLGMDGDGVILPVEGILGNHRPQVQMTNVPRQVLPVIHPGVMLPVCVVAPVVPGDQPLPMVIHGLYAQGRQGPEGQKQAQQKCRAQQGG